MMDPNDPLYRGTPPAYTDPRITSDPAVNPHPTPARRGAELDPQPIGMTQSATIRSIVGGLLVVLAAFGVKLKWTDADTDKITDAIIALAAVVSTALGIYFRIRAERKVVPGAKATDAKSPSNATTTCFALLASAFAYFAAGGCAAMFPPTSTPVSRVYGIKYAFTQAVNEVTHAIDTGMFDNRPDVLRAIPSARRAVENSLATALRLVEEPAQKSNVLFWIDAADKALQHYVELTGAPNRSLPTTLPTTRPADPANDVRELRRRAAA
jgi:hypothetical protein